MSQTYQWNTCISGRKFRTNGSSRNLMKQFLPKLKLVISENKFCHFYEYISRYFFMLPTFKYILRCSNQHYVVCLDTNLQNLLSSRQNPEGFYPYFNLIQELFIVLDVRPTLLNNGLNMMVKKFWNFLRMSATVWNDRSSCYIIQSLKNFREEI